MFRTAAAGRALVRPGIRPILAPAPTAAAVARRTLFGAPAKKKRGPGPKGFKSAAARWALAVGGTYYYLTSSVFAEENSYSKRAAIIGAGGDGGEKGGDQEDDTTHRHRSLDEIRLTKDSTLTTAPKAGPTKLENDPPATEHAAAADLSASVPGATTPGELEEEAGQQGAFNSETGEINWDCPCLGGMAHGPCGEEFRNAFSCFVYSTADPKGMDCIEKFKAMQDCFRKYPEHYGAELESAEDEEEEKEKEKGEEELASAAVAEDTKTTATTTTTTPDTKTTAATTTTAPDSKEKPNTEQREAPPEAGKPNTEQREVPPEA